MVTEDKDKKKDSNVKRKEKEISSVISSKILDYKSKLDAVPVEIMPVTQSEQDRQEVNNLYDSIELPSTQLLDSKFYTQVIKMNRERDKNYLKEGTTRKERIAILAQMITRVTTPIIFLNHKRNIQLSKLFILNDDKEEKKQEKEFLTYEDPVNNIQLPEQLSQADINELKNDVIQKTVGKTWSRQSPSDLNLSDWEADILSQLIRDEELSIQVNKKTGKVTIVKNSVKNTKTEMISFLLEPERDKN